MSFGSTLESDNQLAMIEKTLNKWLKNPPDHDDVKAAYKKRGKLQSDRIRLLREIEKAEDSIIAESDKPRSNDTKKLKLAATSQLKDKLSELDAEMAEHENDVKFLEYQKTMIQVSNWQLKQVMEL